MNIPKFKIVMNDGRFDLGQQTRSAMYRWCIIEMYAWNLYNLINHCHPNKCYKNNNKPLMKIYGCTDNSLHSEQGFPFIDCFSRNIQETAQGDKHYTTSLGISILLPSCPFKLEYPLQGLLRNTLRAAEVRMWRLGLVEIIWMSTW